MAFKTLRFFIVLMRIYNTIIAFLSQYNFPPENLAEWCTRSASTGGWRASTCTSGPKTLPGLHRLANRAHARSPWHFSKGLQVNKTITKVEKLPVPSLLSTCRLPARHQALLPQFSSRLRDVEKAVQHNQFFFLSLQRALLQPVPGEEAFLPHGLEAAREYASKVQGAVLGQDVIKVRYDAGIWSLGREGIY